jgi:hypothetical protein
LPWISIIKNKWAWPSARNCGTGNTWTRKILFYLMPVLIPVVVFGLLLWVAPHG